MAMSQKWCKIVGKLILITNRKSYMSFQLVPKSVTLNEGFPWGDVRKIFPGCQWMAKVRKLPNAVEILPKI